MSGTAEVIELLSLSARLGTDPLLVQASSGNTSIKLDGTLWIKASGKWLAHAAQEETLIPVDLSALRANLRSNRDLPGVGALVKGSYLRASIETAMHAVLPHRVVIHVHSVNTISWAVRLDGPERLAERLAGLCWNWIPYVASGLPLARLIEAAHARQPDTNIFVLANHGLVVCGECCDAAEDLLNEVERRVAVPARASADVDCTMLSRLLDHFPPSGLFHTAEQSREASSPWSLPEHRKLHALGTDALSRRILSGGILYPCQAIFLGTHIALKADSTSVLGTAEHFEYESENPAFGIIESHGIVTNRRITASQNSVLSGLLEVVQRLDEAAPIRYLSDAEVRALLTEDAHRYQLRTERNAMPRDHGLQQGTLIPSSYLP